MSITLALALSAPAVYDFCETSPPSTPKGVVVLGAHHGALGLVRSLGRKGIDVVVIETGNQKIATFSRYARRVLKLPQLTDGLDSLHSLGTKNELQGWLLLPTTDDTVVLVARSSEQLSKHYFLTTPPWSTLQKLCDKRALYRLAEILGIDCPLTVYPKDENELKQIEFHFPVILKPANREVMNPLTRAKAWQVSNRRELLERYEETCRFMDPELIMIQEIIPGGGEAQFSYTALCSEGEVLASVTARRTRQYPILYGRASTFVETIEPIPAVENAARRLLFGVGMHGLVEVEFKRDPAGRYRLLDVNPRAWTWHMLCGRAGVDFPYLLWLLISGKNVAAPEARVGVSWMHFSTDILASVHEMCIGKLSVGSYIRSLLNVQESAILAADDPLPAAMDLPTSIYRSVTRCFHRISAN